MSKYTTGEIAKLCGVSVRTVQYYDSRDLLIPSELSEGGRRLYSEEDLKRMRIICFLRDTGIGINNIGELLREPEPGEVISVLLQQQETVLREELADRQKKLELLEELRREVKRVENFSVESIGDIAHRMKSKREMKKLHATMLITGIPLGIMEWGTVALWILTGIWWPFFLFLFLMAGYGGWISAYYFRRVAYVCPECHEVFRPEIREAFFARHTPTLRKLTCTCCGYHGFCVEVYQEKEEKKHG